MDNNQSIGTSDMPSPQTMAYNKIYTVTDTFLKDLEKTVSELPYVDAVKYINSIKIYNGHIPAAALNEFLRSLGNISYKVVSPLMKNIANKEQFKQYFILEES